MAAPDVYCVTALHVNVTVHGVAAPTMELTTRLVGDFGVTKHLSAAFWSYTYALALRTPPTTTGSGARSKLPSASIALIKYHTLCPFCAGIAA